MLASGIDVQRGLVVENTDAVEAVAQKLVADYNTEWFIVKAQILSGGRGKGTFDTGYTAFARATSCGDPAMHIVCGG